jgi:hypothetical protein
MRKEMAVNQSNKNHSLQKEAFTHESQIEKLIMNMPLSLSSHPHQKIVSDTYLVNQSL